MVTTVTQLPSCRLYSRLYAHAHIGLKRHFPHQQKTELGEATK